jgi:GT2 family glycosyltransferase
MTAPAVSVIIINFNSGDRLSRALKHLDAQLFRDFETIIIDNASSDDSLARARAVAPWAKYIEAGANLGFAAGNNRAVELARGEWLAFLNPDAYAEEGWLQALVAATERYRFADAFGSTQLMDEDPTLLDGAGDVFHIFGIPYRGGYGQAAAQVAADGECFAPCGAAAFYRARVFRALGGFDERFFCYGEDIDLGFRLRLAGGRAVQVRSAIVRHEGSGVTGRYSPFTVYHGNRNRIWATYKSMPAALYWPLAPVRLAADLYLLVRAFMTGRGAAYARALIDGYGGLARFNADRRRLALGRRVSVRALARAFAWSPSKLTDRTIDLRPAAAGEGPA